MGAASGSGGGGTRLLGWGMSSLSYGGETGIGVLSLMTWGRIGRQENGLNTTIVHDLRSSREFDLHLARAARRMQCGLGTTVTLRLTSSSGCVASADCEDKNHEQEYLLINHVNKIYVTEMHFTLNIWIHRYKYERKIIEEGGTKYVDQNTIISI